MIKNEFSISVVFLCLFLGCAKISSDKIYSMSQIDKIPEYPGGLGEFYEYLNNNLSSPSPKDSISLLYRIEIDRNGIVKNISVINGYSFEFDENVKKVIKNSEKWTPGLKDNVEVPVFLDLPFLFLPSK